MQKVTVNENTKDVEIIEFLKPRYVFLPIKKGFRLRCKDNEYVYKNDIVAVDSDGNMITSTISGRVLGVKDMQYVSGVIPSLVIENDFKENIRIRKSARKYLNTIKRKEFLNSLKDASLFYKEYLYKRLDVEETDIIINSIDIEPEFKGRSYLMKTYAEEILEAADIIGSVTGAKKIVIALKNNDSSSISEVMNIIGTYPNIELKLFNDDFANGLDEILKNNLNMPEAIVLTNEEVYQVYEVLKREVPRDQEIISIVGEGAKPNSLVKVKKGSLLAEVFVSNFDFTFKNVDVYLNGFIHGEKVESISYVVDADLEGIYVKEKDEGRSETCLSCGLCSKVCPSGLNPKYVFDHKGNVKKVYYEKCLDCGLCSHVCPAHIDIRAYMRRARNEK